MIIFYNFLNDIFHCLNYIILTYTIIFYHFYHEETAVAIVSLYLFKKIRKREKDLYE